VCTSGQSGAGGRPRRQRHAAGLHRADAPVVSRPLCQVLCPPPPCTAFAIVCVPVRVLACEQVGPGTGGTGTSGPGWQNLAGYHILQKWLREGWQHGELVTWNDNPKCKNGKKTTYPSSVWLGVVQRAPPRGQSGFQRSAQTDENAARVKARLKEHQSKTSQQYHSGHGSSATDARVAFSVPWDLG
jgi:hypothetical protein